MYLNYYINFDLLNNLYKLNNYKNNINDNYNKFILNLIL